MPLIRLERSHYELPEVLSRFLETGFDWQGEHHRSPERGRKEVFSVFIPRPSRDDAKSQASK
jgi:hypothetical protein